MLLRLLDGHLDRPEEPLLRRRSTGDVIGLPLSEPQASADQLVKDNQPCEEDPSDTAAQGEGTKFFSDWRNEVAGDYTWGPFWLQPAVLGSFAGLFLLAAVALAVMIWYSEKNEGLFETRSELEYIWRFAPTAVLTIVAGFWARVAFQASRYMPWIDLQHSKSADYVDFLLDYTSMMFPTVMFQSFCREHFLVSSITIVSVLLKIQIIFAPGLYLLHYVPVWSETEVRLLDMFNTSAWEGTPPLRSPEDIVNGDFGVRLETDCSGYLVPRAIHEFHKLHPFGAAMEAAYQTFEPRGSNAAPVSVIVDGFFTEVRCLKLESFFVIATHELAETGDFRSYDFELSLNFEGCYNLTHTLNLVDGQLRDLEKLPHKTIWALKRAASPCPNLASRVQQMIFSAITFEGSPRKYTPPIVAKFSAVICSQNAWISEVEIEDDGTRPILEILSDRPQTSYNIDIWSMIIACAPDLNSRSNWTGTYRVGPVDLWEQFQDEKQESTASSLRNPEALYDIMTEVTRQLGPFYAHFHFRQPRTPERESSSQRNAHKLLISFLPGVFMSIVFMLMSLTVFLAALRWRQYIQIWHRDPSIVMGNAVFFHHNNHLIDRISPLQNQAQKVPERTTYQLQQASNFGNITLDLDNMQYYANNRVSLSSMLLRGGEGSLVYPKNTFGGLVFPLIGGVPSSIFKVGANVTLEAIMPVATLVSNCSKFTVAGRDGSDDGGLIEYNVEMTCPDGNTTYSSGPFNISRVQPNQPFPERWWMSGEATPKCYEWDASLPFTNDSIYASLTTLTEVYTWEQWNHTSEAFKLISRRSWACHYSWARVMVVVNMLTAGGELIIDHTNPPRPDNSTMHSWNPPLPLPAIDYKDPRLRNSQRRGSSPMEAFAVDHGAKRVAQSPTATYLLLGILGFVAATHIAMLISTFLRRRLGPRRWLLDLDVKGLAPDGFNSIGMMAALLLPSNLMRYMPSQVSSPADNHQQLRGLRFRMGWFRRESDQTRHFTIGVLGDENFTFLGGKNDLDTDGLKKKDKLV
ncbi:hypothetical protein CMUS01_13926 [Colletotrichum musicola]|uniref:Uncharacterized protein n=1 Tax=Colletotrichum musicola TaxID=2175873 RepID=A0A8H6MTA1_9PEZI|nr:hypothetical protein CMUS01_13926 [Colletotrichum musicola]